MSPLVGRTLVARKLQAQMQALGITRESLNDWGQRNGFMPYEYDRLLDACSGRRASRERFLIRLSQRMGLDPRCVLLTACADRVPTSYQGFFLAICDGLERYPEMVEDLQALDGEAQVAILQLVREPEQARRWIQQCRSATQACPP